MSDEKISALQLSLPSSTVSAKDEKEINSDEFSRTGEYGVDTLPIDNSIHDDSIPSPSMVDHHNIILDNNSNIKGSGNRKRSTLENHQEEPDIKKFSGAQLYEEYAKLFESEEYVDLDRHMDNLISNFKFKDDLADVTEQFDQMSNDVPEKKE